MKKISSVLGLSSLLFIAANLINYTQGVYFYLSKNQIKCFKDELLKEQQISLQVTIKDQSIVDYMLDNVDSSYITLMAYDPSRNQVHQDRLQSEQQSFFTARQNGEHKACFSISPNAFGSVEGQQIRAEFKMTSNIDISESQRVASRDQKNDKKQTEQQQQKQVEGGASSGHFTLLKRRTENILKTVFIQLNFCYLWIFYDRLLQKLYSLYIFITVKDILNRQDYDKEREMKYQENLEILDSGFTKLVLIQIGVVVACAIYSVINLKKFFVKKHVL